MKKGLLFTLLSFSSLAMMAQNRQVKIGGGLGFLSEGQARNVELQCEHRISEKLSIFVSLGVNNADITAQGLYGFIPGSYTGVVYELYTDDRDVLLQHLRDQGGWRFQYSERLIYTDVGLKGRLFEPAKGNQIKVVAGSSLGRYIYSGPENVFVNRGMIVDKDNVDKSIGVVMFLIGVENEFSIFERFSISFSLNYRTRFNERRAFTRRIQFGSAPNTTEVRINSSILYSANMTLQVGYRF